jgi:2-(1,2-epoxy-1,2-dihydrophenyl)acetyl-CoA isomerase
MEAAFELAEEIKKMPPLSLRAVKKAVNQGMQGYEFAEYIMDSLQRSEDASEGTSAFLGKREPVFKGR